jgi:curved DNA-binding protein CbpA
MQTYRPSKEQLELLNRDIFKLLGVKPGDSDNAIRKAYFRLAKQLHPDKTGTTADNGFKTMKEAYETLTDPTNRQWYERERLKVLEQAEREEMIRTQDELAKRKREYEARERAKKEQRQGQRQAHVKRSIAILKAEEARNKRASHPAHNDGVWFREQTREEYRRQQAHTQRNKAAWEAAGVRKAQAPHPAHVMFRERQRAFAERSNAAQEAAEGRENQAFRPVPLFAFEDARKKEGAPNDVLKEKSMNYMQAKFEFEESHEHRQVALRKATLAWEELQAARAAYNSMAWKELTAARAMQEFRQKNQDVARVFWSLTMKTMEKLMPQHVASGWMGKSREFPLGWIHHGSG